MLLELLELQATVATLTYDRPILDGRSCGRSEFEQRVATVRSMLFDAAAFWLYDNRESLLMEQDGFLVKVPTSMCPDLPKKRATAGRCKKQVMASLRKAIYTARMVIQLSQLDCSAYLKHAPRDFFPLTESSSTATEILPSIPGLYACFCGWTLAGTRSDEVVGRHGPDPPFDPVMSRAALSLERNRVPPGAPSVSLGSGDSLVGGHTPNAL